jgi:hypothetical protein
LSSFPAENFKWIPRIQYASLDIKSPPTLFKIIANFKGLDHPEWVPGTDR